MSTKSERILRRKLNSEVKNSPLHWQAHKSDISSPFEFDSDVINNDNVSLNSVITPNFINTSTKSKNYNTDPKKIALRQLKKQSNSTKGEHSYDIVKEVPKKKARKVRNTMHDLSNQWTVTRDDDNMKIKPKRLKKQKGPQLLLPVNDILEDKKHLPHENKENETSVDSADAEHEQRKTRRKNLRKKRHDDTIDWENVVKLGSKEQKFNIKKESKASSGSSEEDQIQELNMVDQGSVKRNTFEIKRKSSVVSEAKGGGSVLESKRNDCEKKRQSEVRVEDINKSVEKRQSKRSTFEIVKLSSKENNRRNVSMRKMFNASLMSSENDKDQESDVMSNRKGEGSVVESKRNTYEKKRQSEVRVEHQNEPVQNQQSKRSTFEMKKEGTRPSALDSEISGISWKKFPSTLDDDVFTMDSPNTIKISAATSSVKKPTTSSGSVSTRDDDVCTGNDSSLEISFKVNPRRKSKILDHLNVTQISSRKSSFKKSSRGVSTGSDDEGNKARFVTLRRGCRTLVDWNTTGGEKRKSSDGGEDPARKRDQTGNVSEENRSTDSGSGSVVPGTQAEDNSFDFLSNTTKDDMIDDMDSLVLANSFVNNVSTMPSCVVRQGTFVKDSSIMGSSQRKKSLRKRWSQVERTPIFNRTSPNDSVSVQRRQPAADKSKSVIIITPPKRSPKKLVESEVRASPQPQKRQKSVRIESPLITPKLRMHSPLVVKKTPKTGPMTSCENSFISGSNLFLKASKATPPSNTSTPYPNKKNASLLKRVLTSENHKSDSFAKKSNMKRVKMPNFEKIHQRQFEKMENLKELQERKAMRAKCLLSGNKPPPPVVQTSENAEKESRKQLQFSPTKKGLYLKDGPLKPISKPLQHMLNKRASMEKQKKVLKSRLPVAAVSKPETGRSECQQQQPVKKVTRFGFKLPEKKTLTKEEQIVAVASKTKVTKDRREETRKQLQGVRSNRRFELLMKMREKK